MRLKPDRCDGAASHAPHVHRHAAFRPPSPVEHLVVPVPALATAEDALQAVTLSNDLAFVSAPANGVIDLRRGRTLGGSLWCQGGGVETSRQQRFDLAEAIVPSAAP